jgi:hypothetical protein
MRFWTREVAGWLLIGIGLFAFYKCLEMLTLHFILEAGPLTLIGIIVFRGGIHLLKVATAAEVCTEAREICSSQRFAALSARPSAARRPAPPGAPPRRESVGKR